MPEDVTPISHVLQNSKNNVLNNPEETIPNGQANNPETSMPESTSPESPDDPETSSQANSVPQPDQEPENISPESSQNDQPEISSQEIQKTIQKTNKNLLT